MDRLTESLAERLYRAHNEWRADLSESDVIRPYWFALHDDLKADYRRAAETLIAAESKVPS